MTFTARHILLGSLLALLAGCNSQSTPDQNEPQWTGPEVATVNGESIPQDLQLGMLRVRGQTQANEQTQAQAISDLIDLYLLEDYAASSGLLDRDTTRANLEVRRLMMIAELALAHYQQQSPVSDEAIRAAYDAQLARTGSREFHLRQLLTPTAEAIVELKSRLDAGEAFTNLEKEVAEQYGVSAAGDLGWVSAPQLPQPLADVATALTEDSYSEPVQSDYGWHIMYLERTRPFNPPEFDKVKEGIRATLSRNQTQAFLESLRRDAVIETPSD